MFVGFVVRALTVQSWARKEFPAGRRFYLWCNDFHVSPIACNEPIFNDAGVEVHGEIDFGNCIFNPKFCKKRLKVCGGGGGVW